MNWQKASSPESVGMSTTGMQTYTQWLHTVAAQEAYGTLIVRKGLIAHETYGSGGTENSKWEIGSIRKSVTGALLAMAIAENRLTLDTFVHDIWPDIYTLTDQSKDKQIQMRHLATNTSGWMTDRGPDEQWLYNNAACTAGGTVLGRIYDLTNDLIAPLVYERIAQPIGANGWDCYHYDETFTPGNHGNPGPKLAIDSNLRDLARYGYLWLRQGQWQKQTLISKPYCNEAKSNRTAHLNGHYGYWWFTNDRQILLPDAPADTFYHVGNGRNNRRTVLLIIPSLDLIAIVGTSALAYDINANYKARPVFEVNDWIARILNAIIE